MSVLDELGDASNVLLLGSSLNPATRQTEFELLSSDESSPVNALVSDLHLWVGHVVPPLA